MITKKPDFPDKFSQFNIFAKDFHVIHNNHKRLVSYFRVPCQYPFLCLARQYPQPWPHLLYETFNSRPSATETTLVQSNWENLKSKTEKQNICENQRSKTKKQNRKAKHLYETFNSRPSATETTFVRTPSSCVSAGSGCFEEC